MLLPSSRTHREHFVPLVVKESWDVRWAFLAFISLLSLNIYPRALYLRAALHLSVISDTALVFLCRWGILVWECSVYSLISFAWLMLNCLRRCWGLRRIHISLSSVYSDKSVLHLLWQSLFITAVHLVCCVTMTTKVVLYELTWSLKTSPEKNKNEKREVICFAAPLAGPFGTALDILLLGRTERAHCQLVRQ